MPKELTLEQATDFLNTIITQYDHVGVKRIVTPSFRFSEPAGDSIPLYSASMIPNSLIQLQLTNGTGAFTLYTTNLKFVVREMDNGNDSFIYRFEAGEDIHFILVVRNNKPYRTPLQKFMGS